MMTDYPKITDSYGNLLRRDVNHRHKYFDFLPACPSASSFTRGITSIDEVRREDILSFHSKPGREGRAYWTTRTLTAAPHYVIGVSEKSLKLVSLCDGHLVIRRGIFHVPHLFAVFDNLDISLSELSPGRSKYLLTAIAHSTRSFPEQIVRRPEM